MQTDTKTTWTLEEAIQLARRIEAAFTWGNYHVALGGGCLTKDGERKDCDIFLYPHNTYRTQKDSQVLKVLKTVGIEVVENRQPEHKEEYEDEKKVWHCNIDGRRVDIFIVQ